MHPFENRFLIISPIDDIILMLNPFDVLIKIAEPADINFIIEIENESIALWTGNQFMEELNCSFSIFLAAVINNVPAGYISAWRAADELQINSIAVRPEYRGLGIGKKLIDEAIRLYSGGGPEKIILEVSESNITAIRFYEKCGFIKTGIRKNFYKDADARIMEKILNESKKR